MEAPAADYLKGRQVTGARAWQGGAAGREQDAEPRSGVKAKATEMPDWATGHIRHGVHGDHVGGHDEAACEEAGPRPPELLAAPQALQLETEARGRCRTLPPCGRPALRPRRLVCGTGHVVFETARPGSLLSDMWAAPDAS